MRTWWRWKNGDPNGNGEADEIPYSAGNPEQFVQLFHSTFGIATRGLSSGYIDADESGALRFWPTADGYRDELEYLQRLYADGLIQQDIFTTDAASYNTLGQEDVFGAAAASPRRPTSVVRSRELHSSAAAQTRGRRCCADLEHGVLAAQIHRAVRRDRSGRASDRDLPLGRLLLR